MGLKGILLMTGMLALASIGCSDTNTAQEPDAMSAGPDEPQALMGFVVCWWQCEGSWVGCFAECAPAP